MLIHSSADENMGCFYFLAFMNCVSSKILAQVSMWTSNPISLSYIPKSRISGFLQKFEQWLFETIIIEMDYYDKIIGILIKLLQASKNCY